MEKYKNYRVVLRDRFNDVVLNTVILQAKRARDARRIAGLYKKRYYQNFIKQHGRGFFPSGLKAETFKL